MNPAAANRLNALADQYPLASKAGDALYEAGDSYSKMGPRFRKQAGEMFARVVSDYPLSDRVKLATKRLQEMELPVPPVNQKALERAKWEQANRVKQSMLKKTMVLASGGPDLSHVARSGQPTMTDPKKTLPASIPVVNNDVTPAAGGMSTEVTAGAASSGKLDNGADARTTTTTPPAASATPAAPLPTNRDAQIAKYREAQQKKLEKQNRKKKKTTDTAATPTPSGTTPPAGSAPPAATTAATPPPQE
jgi:outer membrane protein assembly factor BamD